MSTDDRSASCQNVIIIVRRRSYYKIVLNYEYKRVHGIIVIVITRVFDGLITNVTETETHKKSRENRQSRTLNGGNERSGKRVRRESLSKTNGRNAKRIFFVPSFRTALRDVAYRARNLDTRATDRLKGDEYRYCGKELDFKTGKAKKTKPFEGRTGARSDETYDFRTEVLRRDLVIRRVRKNDAKLRAPGKRVLL